MCKCRAVFHNLELFIGDYSICIPIEFYDFKVVDDDGGIIVDVSKTMDRVKKEKWFNDSEVEYRGDMITIESSEWENALKDIISCKDCVLYPDVYEKATGLKDIHGKDIYVGDACFFKFAKFPDRVVACERKGRFYLIGNKVVIPIHCSDNLGVLETIVKKIGRDSKCMSI